LPVACQSSQWEAQPWCVNSDNGDNSSGQQIACANPD
jgi:hypothetical protein